jgi:hypothetical protein
MLPLPPLPLLAAFQLVAAPPADAPVSALRLILGAESASRGEGVPGVILVQTSAAADADAALLLTSAAPARLWWRAAPEEGCADHPRGEPVLTLAAPVADALYFCARPEEDGPLRLAATFGTGIASAVAVSDVPRARPGGFSPAGLALVTALLGLGSGILVNYFTSRNQLRNELARRRQEMDAAEREKRIQVVGAVHASLLTEIQRALHALREYAGSEPRQPERDPVVTIGGMQVVMETELVRTFMEREHDADFQRLRRIYTLLSEYNRRVRHEEQPAARRALARRTVDEIEAQTTALR